MLIFYFYSAISRIPYDYSRRIHKGMKILFKDFKKIELIPYSRPTSGFLWILQEWLALMFSFGIKKFHLYLSLFFMILTFPIKYIDFILIKHPMAVNISSAFLYRK